jgi:hypothetical protein
VPSGKWRGGGGSCAGRMPQARNLFLPGTNCRPTDSEARSRNPHPLPAYYMTDALLGWWPILWTARLFVLILLLGACAASALYFLRFFRLKHVRAMWNARLPRVRSVGGKWGDTEFGVGLDQDQDEQFEAIRRQLAELESLREIDREAIERVARYLLRKEGQYEFFDSRAGPPPGTTGGDADSG